MTDFFIISMGYFLLPVSTVAVLLLLLPLGNRVQHLVTSTSES